MWGATQSWNGTISAKNFNPRTPCGVRRYYYAIFATVTIFQSTHPVWGATLICLAESFFEFISIHAPRVGCDPAQASCLRCVRRYFNPRTPCGVRHFVPYYMLVKLQFQSTHPVWGATLYDELSQERRRKIRGGPPIFCGGNQKKPRYFTANRAESGTSPAVRAKRARVLRCHISAKRRIARPFPSSDFPDSKSADCPFPGPSDGSACP